MSDTRLPVPPLRIPVETLPRSLRGYDRGATRELVEHLAGVYEALWVECATLRKSDADLNAELARRDEGEEMAAAALVYATRSAFSIKEEARVQARLTMRKARAKAASIERITELQAKVTADALVSEARLELREIKLEITRLEAVAREVRGEVSARLATVLRELDERFPPTEEAPPPPEMRDELQRALDPFSSRASEGAGHVSEFEEDHGAAADVA